MVFGSRSDMGFCRAGVMLTRIRRSNWKGKTRYRTDDEGRVAVECDVLIEIYPNRKRLWSRIKQDEGALLPVRR